MSPTAPFGVSLAVRQLDPNESMASSWEQLTDPMRSQGALGDDEDSAMNGHEEVGREARRLSGAVVNHIVQEVRRPAGEVWFKEMTSIIVDKELIENLMRKESYSAETVDAIHVFMEQVGLKFAEIAGILVKMRDLLSARGQEFVNGSNLMAHGLNQRIMTTK